PVQEAKIEFNPVRVNFGSVKLGDSKDRTVRMKNSGNIEASITTPTLSGEFSFTGGSYPGTNGDCGTTLAAGADCDLDLSYEPTNLGSDSANLNVAYSDDFASRFATLPMEAEGRAAAVCGSSKVYNIVAKNKADAARDMATAILPYLSSNTQNGETMDLLYGTETNYTFASVNRSTVRDGQVYFVFDIAEFKDGSITIEDVSLELDLTKVHLDKYPRTEILCFLDQKLCSGFAYVQTPDSGFKNPAFWGSQTQARNQRFLNELLQTENIQWLDGKNICLYVDKHEYDLDDLFRVNESVFIDEIQNGNNTLEFSLADDVQNNAMPILKIKASSTRPCQ
ncbi:MAG: choice-of-anchor D domain-containing protein, partial [Deltaproteobacteria bacterium]